MNTKYINIDVLEKMVVDSKNNNPHSNSIHRQMHTHEHQHFLCMIASLPIADVAEVKYGEWINKTGLYECSVCGKTCPYDVQADVILYWECKYCPHCGADMGGGTK